MFVHGAGRTTITNPGRENIMDAPVYPPSAAWEAPVVVQQPMTTRNASLADFVADPEAKAIIISEMPAFQLMISSPQLKPHLSNVTPRAMADLGMFKGDALDRVDAKLAAAGILQGTAPR